MPKSKNFILILLFLSLIIFTGFSPTTTHQTINSENIFFSKYKQASEQLKKNNYEEALKLLEIHNIIDSFYYTIEKNNIDSILYNYKNILIDKANSHLNNGEYIMAGNLLNSRQKYYQSDSTINNLISYNKKLINSSQLTPYDGDIEHLVFNTLIAFPEKAFDERNNHSSIYDETKLTPSEFQNILNQLYNNNYIIVDIEEIYEISDNKIYKKQLKLPKGKKPIILSFDNVSYRSNFQNVGEIDKIIVDRNNKIATYTTKKRIQDRVQYDNEFVVILESFIENHPDFSFNDARGIIFLSGENGVLGYNTNHKNASSRFETKRVSEVITKLRNLGWKFGCNNYKYEQESLISDIEFAKQLSLWNQEVLPTIGNTNLYAYPYGQHSEKDTTKQELLITNGFEIFFVNNNDPTLEFLNEVCIMSRREINGLTLRKDSDKLSHLFNCEKVYDHTNRTVSFYNLSQ